MIFSNFNFRANLELEHRIEKDPEMIKLTSEARRLSMGGSARRTDALSHNEMNEGRAISPMNGSTRRSVEKQPPIFSRKTSESLGLGGSGNRSRSGSESERDRKPSNELTMAELQQRRMSEAGLRRPSACDAVLNEDTSSLMVGMTVYVDGNKKGRIAYIGEVHFAKGEMAGIHLDRSIGKNNGTVGGIMYFQCEPKRGVFSRLHRLTREPMVISDEAEY